MNNRYYYKYNINMSYQYKDKLINFDASTIQSLAINFDYRRMNMPTMILKVQIDRSVLDDMIENQSHKTVILTISKVMKDVDAEIRQEYIKDEFIYFLSENKNYNKELDYEVNGLNQDHPKNRMKIVTLGLMKYDLIKNNKMFINGIYKDARAIDILYDNMKHMNLLIEPFDNTEKRKQIIIPQMDTITKLVKYLNLNMGFYKDLEYTLFYDFDKTYLVSSQGNKVPAKNEPISSVMIYLNKTVDNSSKIRGFSIDRHKQAYVIDMDANDSSIVQSKIQNVSYDTTVVLNSEGKGDIEGDRIKLLRNTGGSILNKKTNEETIVNIVKTELDSSIFTINKEYYIRNYNKIDGLTAKFRLIKKQEIYTKEDDHFNLANILSFKKIDPSA